MYPGPQPVASETAEVDAFPLALAATVRSTAADLSTNQLLPLSSRIIQVRLNNESLKIPYRVYYDKDRLLRRIDDETPGGVVSVCLGTRHYDGFIREKCLRRLLDRDEDWVIPFIVQLLGEYVVEIVIPIQEALLGIDGRSYGRYLAENGSYFETLRRQATSYWNVYYRTRYLKLEDYPAMSAIVALKGIRDTAITKVGCQGR